MIERPTLTISILTTVDLAAVDGLMKRNGSTLGFLPLVALEDYLLRENMLGAKTREGQLVGYLMFAANRDRFRIAQLCVCESYRGSGVARMLLDALKATTSTQKIVILRCRNDFSAHAMWPKLGFVPIDESPGRSKEGRLLTLWRFQLAPSDQSELFRANLSDDVFDAAFDTQIFFDFDAPHSEVTQPSKALISDQFVDSVNLWYTDELYSEISRHRNASEREEARTRAKQFLELRHDPQLIDDFVAKLKRILPARRTNQMSDIMHLAKTAASEIEVFVTRDRLLLNRARQINDAVNVLVQSPTGLIVKLREITEAVPYAPDYVSGPGLAWRRLTSQELLAFPFERFLQHGEKRRDLETKVNSLLSNTSASEVEVLWFANEPIALRGLAYGSASTITVTLCRLTRSDGSPTIRQFPMEDVLSRAIANGFEMVKIEESALPIDLRGSLLKIGFTSCAGGFVRFCFTRYLAPHEALSRIASLFPESTDTYKDMAGLELERFCSPLIAGPAQNYYLIPIKPGYARNLVDRRLSSSDMFGGAPEVLLSWNNAYYRTATHHRSLTAPAGILWYVSRDLHEIVAVSNLNEVVLGTPKELFKRFRKLGTFEWDHLFDLCGGDLTKNAMALLFSHTFPLRRRVPLEEIWEVFAQDGVGQSLQSPRKLRFGTFRKLFRLGYPEQS